MPAEPRAQRRCVLPACAFGNGIYELEKERKKPIELAQIWCQQQLHHGLADLKR